MSSSRFKELISALKSKRMLVVLFLGFSSGLPIMLIAGSLKIWLRREGIDLSTIGFISWVMLPYSFNFLWAPLLDRFSPFSIGRRRSWMLLAQAGLIGSLIAVGLSDPHLSLPLLVAAATAVAFFSATQDIAIDAYRREILKDEEQGVGAALGVYGYRIGMWVASGFGLWAVSENTLGLSFNQMFFMMAGVMSVGVATTFFATRAPVEGAPRNLKNAIIEPFMEFFSRRGAIYILLFIFTYKLGDQMVGSLLGAYYVDMKFSNEDIAYVAKTFGLFSTFIGLAIGGATIYKIGPVKSLFLFGILQGVTTLSFILLQYFPGEWGALAVAVALEDMTSGMGTAALVAFMATMTNRKYTATQYALFSSLAAAGRTFFAGFSGLIAETWGYTALFIVSSAMAIPGLVLIVKVSRIRAQVAKENQAK